MARSDTRFRKTYNTLIEQFSGLGTGKILPSETALAEAAGVSRTVVRTAMQRLQEQGIIAIRGSRKLLQRPPGETDRLPTPQASPRPDELEAAFLDWVLKYNGPLDKPMNIARLARDFGVAPPVLQELLAGLSPFGLVKRGGRGGWFLLGFTPEFAIELSEFREMLELHAVGTVLSCPVDHEVWKALEQLRCEHNEMEKYLERDLAKFPRLDEQLHVTLNSVVSNRLFVQFRKLFSMIFHCHYSWNQTDLLARGLCAIREHQAIITALQLRDEAAAVAATRRHMRTSMTNLLIGLRSRRAA